MLVINIVNRHEVKYLISDADYYKFDSVFKQMLLSDKNNGLYGYFIRSLYFDSRNNDDYLQKINGEEVRKKIRLRIYDVDTLIVKLEIKRKINLNQVKETINISKDDAKALIKKDYSVLLKYTEKTASTIYNIMILGQYEPVVVVDYIRKAYIHKENSIRLTLDSDIKSNETNFDIFSEKLLMKPISDYYTPVFEVKYNNNLFSWITSLISGRDIILTSFSKYCNSRSFYENYIF